MHTYVHVCILFIAVLHVDIGEARCQNDWVQYMDSCYLFIDEHVPWTSAQVMCHIMGGKMLEVETQAENEFVVGQLQARPGVSSVWIGLQDFAREGRWVWSSNLEPSEYLNWLSGHPDNSHSHGEGGQDCAFIRHDGLWDDHWCENVYATNDVPAVSCEAEASADNIVG